jgi:hypothetical protein
MVGARTQLVVAVLAFAGTSRAAEPPATVKLTPIAYVEAAYSYNFAEPSNGITAYRGFDNRHNTFALSNVALGIGAEYGPVEARVVMQVGQTPSTYYLAEPNLAGGGGVGATSSELWKYVQEAWLAYKAPIGRGLRLQAGVCLSPIGPETIPVKDNWSWSRSNLFFGLPFYHMGLKASYDLSDRWSVTGAVYNGWNNVIDGNLGKSAEGHVTYKIPDKLTVQLLYFGGVERARNAPEGPYWRHDFDAWAQWDLHKRISLLAEINGGVEPNRFGTSDWYAGAFSARFRPFDWLYVSARGDAFFEDVASNASGTASSIFWPSRWVSSQTATIDVRPTEDHLSVRLEYRHDMAAGPTYFRGVVVGDGSTANPFLPNGRSQDTLTVGATAWF